jgi:hypothetical protein
MPDGTTAAAPSAGYADTTALAAYLGTTVPDDAIRLLLRASELVDFVTMGRIDTTDTTHMAAAETATCAIVEYWEATGEPTGATSTGSVSGYTVGKISVDCGTTGGGANPSAVGLPQRAKQALLAAGLLYAGVAVV